jgi:hypothetical protein
VVFTLPQQIADLALSEPGESTAFFQDAAETLLTICHEPLTNENNLAYTVPRSYFLRRIKIAAENSNIRAPVAGSGTVDICPDRNSRNGKQL